MPVHMEWHTEKTLIKQTVANKENHTTDVRTATSESMTFVASMRPPSPHSMTATSQRDRRKWAKANNVLISKIVIGILCRATSSFLQRRWFN